MSEHDRIYNYTSVVWECRHCGEQGVGKRIPVLSDVPLRPNERLVEVQNQAMPIYFPPPGWGFDAAVTPREWVIAIPGVCGTCVGIIEARAEHVEEGRRDPPSIRARCKWCNERAYKHVGEILACQLRHLPKDVQNVPRYFTPVIQS